MPVVPSVFLAIPQNQINHSSLQCRFSFSLSQSSELGSKHSGNITTVHHTQHQQGHLQYCALYYWLVRVCVWKQHLETMPSARSRPTGHRGGQTARSTNQTAAGQPFLRIRQMNAETPRDSGGQPAPWRRAESWRIGIWYSCIFVIGLIKMAFTKALSRISPPGLLSVSAASISLRILRQTFYNWLIWISVVDSMYSQITGCEYLVMTAVMWYWVRSKSHFV